MSSHDFFAIAARRWYVVAAGLVLTVAVLLTQQHRSPTYWSRVTVVVLPSRDYSENVLTQQGPVAVAGLAVLDVTKKPTEVKASSSDATLYGLGVTSGTWIRLRNTGGQWSPTAASPNIDIDAVDHTPEAVAARIDSAVNQVRNAILTRERTMRVAPRSRAGFQEVPGAPVVRQVPASRARAELTTGMAGAGWTVVALVVLQAAVRHISDLVRRGTK